MRLESGNGKELKKIFKTPEANKEHGDLESVNNNIELLKGQIRDTESRIAGFGDNTALAAPYYDVLKDIKDQLAEEQDIQRRLNLDVN